MEVIYKWIISEMECIPQEENLTDVVVVVHWRRWATTIANDKPYYAEVYDAQNFTQIQGENFTPYNELTYEQVCGWLDSSVNVEMYDQTLTIQLENLINPPIIVLPLPWTTPLPTEPLPTETLPEPTPTPTETTI